jgi:hypothetical protein
LSVWHEARTAEAPHRVEIELSDLAPDDEDKRPARSPALDTLVQRGAELCFIDTVPSRGDENAKLFRRADLLSVGIRLDMSNLSAFVEPTHKTRDDREGDRIITDRIHLTWTSPTYGGRRWWFQCPRTGRRTTKLFLPNGGWHFWSRQAYGLGYACQREDRFGRLQRRAAMLNRQLGGEGWGSWDTPPTKPKWTRWRTYERKYERWERAVDKAGEEFTIRAAHLLKWL